MQVCDFLHGDNTTLVWDNEQQVPFAYRKDQWVGFDDERSLRTKVFNCKQESVKAYVDGAFEICSLCEIGGSPLIRHDVHLLQVKLIVMYIMQCSSLLSRIKHYIYLAFVKFSL